jgi:hypothetical protein
MQYKTINNYETMSLKSLALLVLERNSNRNKSETHNDNFVSVQNSSVSYSLIEKLKLLSPTKYEEWEERAAIMEYEASIPRNIAEIEAYNNVIKVNFDNSFFKQQTKDIL